MNATLDVSEILQALHQGRLMIVNSRRRNGVIIHKGYHTEFAGPGAAIGGVLDLHTQEVIPVGNLSLLEPASHEDSQSAYLIRRQWIRLTEKFTQNAVPQQRAQMILNQFQNYFDEESVAQISDEALALMVGVLPQTIRLSRQRLHQDKP